MRQSRIKIVAVLLATGLLGAYLVATAQESPVPWPPPPVKTDAVRSDMPPIPPPVSPDSYAPPGQAETKKPATDKTTGPVRKWVSGLLPAAGQDAGKPKSGLQQVGHKESAQELPPPIPPKLTVDPMPPPAMPPAADSSDLPPIPMPTAPVGMSSSEPKAAPPLPKVVVPQTQVDLPPMLAADPPMVDPRKSVITEPVQQVPLPKAAPGKNTVLLPPISMPPAEAPPGNPSSGAPQQPGAPKTPAFVLLNARKTENVPVPVSVPVPVTLPSPPPTASSALSTGQGAPPSWPAAAPAPLPTESVVSRASNSQDPAPTVLGVQTPPITVEKRGRTPQGPGEPMAFQIIVRNLGTMAAQQVRVEDELPADAKIVSAEPTPHMQGNRAVWHLNELPAGGMAVLSLTLQPGLSGNLNHSTIVHVVGTASITTAASAPVAASVPAAAQQAAALAVQVTAPTGVVLGRPAVFELTYTNQTNQRMTGLMLHVQLSAGLHHPVGQSIEAEVSLEPGASKTVKLEASTVAPGRQSVQVRLARPGGPDASAGAALDVAPGPIGLTIQQMPATRVFVGRTNDLRLEVTNNSAKPMRHVSLVSYLPEGVDFVAAGDHGNYQPNSRTVNWLVDTLAPGQSQGVLVRVQGRTTGQLPHQVLARADGVPDIRSSGVLAVEGIADIAVSLQGEPALEVGKEAVYEVRVANPGSGANTNVRVEVTLTPGLVARNAQGPMPFRIEGQTIIFENLALLVPQGQAVYRIAVVGESPGDRRVRVSVISDQVRAPATRESGTRVYRD